MKYIQYIKYIKYIKCTSDWSEEACQEWATSCQSYKEADTEPGIEVGERALEG
jgi:hypothetical protein